ncbi:GH32 C-terminal domain-containing protein [Priestia megaterium]|nr:GH32 C-terminal domain-containing protein [Priestia megaterium]MDN4865696.1 GH32 C-terminal domain-containing protein [Priestia megaterium]
MKRVVKKLLTVGMACSLTLLAAVPVFAQDSGYYQEEYRNQFHFSPEVNWMNDPNGMIYYKGEYHLFYQYNPYGTTWGNLHWGHAVSKDLVHWKQLPIALSPDENGDIFSGSAVIDWHNTAGFGKEAMIAVFTHSGSKGQVQSIAYSNDKGRTWKKYKGNPVMPNPPGPDWRDPKVFWHDETHQWVMSLAAKNKIMFYTSPDLKNWKYASEFGPDGGIQANGQRDAYSYTLSEQKGQSFTLEGDISLVEKNGREGAGGLVFRSNKDATNAYTVNLDAQKDLLTLSKINQGKVTDIASKSIKLDTSQTYHVKVKANTNNFKVSLNGKQAVEGTDSSFESGQFGLTAWNSTSVFRNVKFVNKTNFMTNLSGWKTVSGTWNDTNDGKSGKSEGDGFIMSKEQGQQFSYESDMTVSGDKGGSGALVFRADANAKNGYVASIDASTDKIKLSKLENGVSTVIDEKNTKIDTDKTYRLKVTAAGNQIGLYLNNDPILTKNDSTFSKGVFGLYVGNSSVKFQNVTKGNFIVTDVKEIENPDFETGDLSGWKTVSGDAFTNDHVTKATTNWSGLFDQNGKYHLWGFSDKHNGDDATGELHSSYFKLSGSGEINLLMGGGNDIKNRYVSLVRASDDKELIRQANTKFADEKYQRYVWDASKYLGEVLYIKAVDNATGGWGHINLDDVNVFNTGKMPTQVDNVAKEPQIVKQRESGMLSDWNTVAGDWVESTYGSNGGIWECPTLIQLPVDGNPKNKKWVLQVSINDGATAGGSGMQYFVGNFDGKTFKSENRPDQVLWSDYGADFYAGVDWSDIEGENGERYWLSWMSNWQYAPNTPTTTWRSSTSLPRELELTKTTEGVRLKQTPVSLKSIRNQQEKINFKNRVISDNSNLLSGIKGDTYEMIAEFDVSNTKATEFGFQVRKGKNEHTTIGYDVNNQKLFVDRTNSGSFNFGENVKGKHSAPLSSKDGTIKLHIFIDRSSAEVFGNDGTSVITDQLFPNSSSNGLQLYSKGGAVKLKSLDVYPLKSTWGKSPVHTKMSGWKTISGLWADTIDGKQGQSQENASTLSSEKGRDFTYEANIKVLNNTVSNPTGAGALVFRSDVNAKNAYAANVDVLNNKIKLVKFTDGVGKDLAVYNDNGKLKLKGNTDYNLRVIAKGENIKVYLDDKLVIDETDNSFTEGFAGLNVWNSTSVFNEIKFKSRK